MLMESVWGATGLVSIYSSNKRMGHVRQMCFYLLLLFEAFQCDS